jgi:hypothetical protein
VTSTNYQKGLTSSCTSANLPILALNRYENPERRALFNPWLIHGFTIEVDAGTARYEYNHSAEKRYLAPESPRRSRTHSQLFQRVLSSPINDVVHLRKMHIGV